MNDNSKSLKIKSDDGLLQSTALKRLLLVEDNDLNRLMLDDYLTFCGYQVFSLACGANFFEEIANFQPHLILLDLKLPDVNGYILLEQLQINPLLRDIPVIVVSAFAFKADCQRALNLGVREYFIKPVNLDKLRQAISKELTN